MAKKNGFINEFKEFIMRGNVLDMAVGVIIAGAFGKITTSLVNDVFMPFLGWVIGDFDMSKLNLTLVEEVKNAAGEITTPAVSIGFGTLLATVIDFLLIAFMVFVIVKLFNKARELGEAALKKKTEEEVEEIVEAAPPAPTTEELLTEILAEMKKNNQ